MDDWIGSSLGVRKTLARRLIYILLLAFIALLWLLLLAFRWEVSLRAREAYYFGRQLFPLRAQAVPLTAVYAAFALLSAATIGLILRDRRKLAMQERIQTLLFQILQSLEIGVLVLNRRGQLTLANESARKILPELTASRQLADPAGALMEHPGLSQIIESAVARGQYVRERDHNLGSPEESFQVRITTLPLKDLEARVNGTLLLISDVREQVAMERQMRTAERLSALGTLAAALAHEIRNPLEAISLNLELLERALVDGPPNPIATPKKGKYLGILSAEIARLGATVENFLSFARPVRGISGPVEVVSILSSLVALVENQAAVQNVTFTLQLDAPSIVVEGFEDQLKQAFLNLLINSLEAMPDGGRLALRAGIIGDSRTGASGPFAVVRIQDTGPGIPPEEIERLFDPYYSTKPKGTGLGLTIVHRILQEHRGRIRVESEPGSGSTFIIELPATSALQERHAL